MGEQKKGAARWSNETGMTRVWLVVVLDFVLRSTEHLLVAKIMYISTQMRIINTDGPMSDAAK